MVKAGLSYNQKENAELMKLLAEKESEFFKAKMDAAQGKTKDVHASKKIRRDIARIKTAIRIKELKV